MNPHAALYGGRCSLDTAHIFLWPDLSKVEQHALQAPGRVACPLRLTCFKGGRYVPQKGAGGGLGMRIGWFCASADPP